MREPFAEFRRYIAESERTIFMKQIEFIEGVTRILRNYINNSRYLDSNAQLRVNPATMATTIVNGRDMLAELADSDEAVEDAAAADGLRDEDSTDYQATQNPDFYSVRMLIQTDRSGQREPSMPAIMQIADSYFRQPA